MTISEPKDNQGAGLEPEPLADPQISLDISSNSVTRPRFKHIGHVDHLFYPFVIPHVVSDVGFRQILIVAFPGLC